ncbi:transposable element Tcb1 transposase [Trichonephila clavipes]|nr:transposable element Tcb1 transposase [Trichonephila clavipes]
MYNYQKLLECLRLKCTVDIKTAFEDEDEPDPDIFFETFYDIIQSKLSLKTSLKDAEILFHQIDAYGEGKIKYKNLVDYLEKYEECRSKKVISRRKQRSAFDQVSEFDRGRIVAYRDCGLSFRKIGSRVGRNQTTVMRICDRWMQEGTTDRRGRSHPPQCTTSREDRQIVRMAVTDRSVTLRTIAQPIESVAHHSVSARTIRQRLQQSGLSARCPLLGLSLTQNHRLLRRQWCDEKKDVGGRME